MAPISPKILPPVHMWPVMDESELEDLTEEMCQLPSVWTEKAPKINPYQAVVPDESVPGAGPVLRTYNNVPSADPGEASVTAYRATRRNNRKAAEEGGPSGSGEKRTAEEAGEGEEQSSTKKNKRAKKAGPVTASK